MFFGKDLFENEITIYTIENENIAISAIDYGATLVSFIDKKTGIDVVCGFDDMEGYLNQQGACMGASIGRVANRIANGEFSLNNNTYHLERNNNGNTLHGGLFGFDQKLFDTKINEQEIIFSYTSKDGEEGFPGNLKVEIKYKLLENGLSIVSKGSSDQDTLFGYTNHSYFNLDGVGDIKKHKLKIPGDFFGLNDSNGMMNGQLKEVDKTDFDFRSWREVGIGLNSDDSQIKDYCGYDHYYPIEGTGLRTQAQLEGRRLRLTLMSDFPGFHLYTGNFLANMKGKKEIEYGQYSGLCLEAEYMPNAINYNQVDKPIVYKDKSLVHEIQYHLERVEHGI